MTPPAGTEPAALSPDALQLAFHEVECRTYDERFGLAYDEHTARHAADEVGRLLGAERFGRVADIGCGTGFLGLGLARAGRVGDLHLVDLSPGMLGRARDHAASLGVEATFVRATATALPYPGGHFDAVVTRGVLHHLEDPVAALREWRRVARPGAPVVVLSEPTPVADRIGAVVARGTLGGLAAARRAAAAIGRPLSAYEPEQAEVNQFWDLVAMAANLHTFTPRGLRELARQAGFTRVRVRGSGLASIGWAGAYYCLVGQLPGLAASDRAKQRAGRAFAGLRRFDAAVVERLVPGRLLLTVQAVLRA